MALPTSNDLQTLGFGGFGYAIQGPTVAKSNIDPTTLGYGGYNYSIFGSNPFGAAVVQNFSKFFFFMDFFFAKVAAPTVQTSAISSSTKTRTTIDWAWTIGNGDFRMAYVISGTTNTNLPTDGVSYTANSTYGSGSTVGTAYCVYSGTGSGFTLTGLTSNTNYTIVVVEVANGLAYNKTVTTSVNRLTIKTSL